MCDKIHAINTDMSGQNNETPLWATKFSVTCESTCIAWETLTVYISHTSSNWSSTHYSQCELTVKKLLVVNNINNGIKFGGGVGVEEANTHCITHYWWPGSHIFKAKKQSLFNVGPEDVKTTWITTNTPIMNKEKQHTWFQNILTINLHIV